MTVLVLLLVLLGLTVIMSSASRSLSDLKQTTYVDSGTKAFAAAEAGLQYALNDVTSNHPTLADCAGTLTPQTISGMSIPNIQSITYQSCSNTRKYVMQTGVGKDEAMQVDLTGMPSNVQFFDVAWSNALSAVEVILVHYDNSISRFIFNGSSVVDANGFDSTTVSSGSSCNDNTYCPVSSFANCRPGNSSPNITHIGGAHGDKFIRIKPLYNASDLALCARGPGQPGLSQQQTVEVTATATTVDGTVKRLKATKTPATLPGIFDYAVYSRGQIIK